jgi:hypothetical protein
MKKLKLDLDALGVETFDPSPLEEERGTVLGEQLVVTLLTCGPACFTVQATCHFSCRLTCGATCFLSCNNTCLRTCGLTCLPTCAVSCFSCVGPTCGATCYIC